MIWSAPCIDWALKSCMHVILRREGKKCLAGMNLIQFMAIISLAKGSLNDIIIIPKEAHGLPLQLVLVKFKTAEKLIGADFA